MAIKPNQEKTVGHKSRRLVVLLGFAFPFACAVEGETETPSSDTDRRQPPLIENDNGSATQDSEPMPELQAACTYRPDFVTSITPGEGSWGTWAQCFEWCPTPRWPRATFANVIVLKSEAPRGGGDDTALNGIALDCAEYASDPQFPGYITSSVGGWGKWMDWASECRWFNPMVAAQIMIEGSQGSGDDTAANRLIAKCKDGTWKHPDAYTSWGTWRDPVSCPENTAICGIRTRVESSRGNGDDTSLNGVELACCRLPW